MKFVGESLGSSIYMSKWYMKDKGPIKQFFVYKQIKIYLLLRLHDNAKSRFIWQHYTYPIRIFALFSDFSAKDQIKQKLKQNTHNVNSVNIIFLEIDRLEIIAIAYCFIVILRGC